MLARLDRLSSGWLGALALFGCGLAVYAVRASAWPLKAGRDLDEYLYAYIQLFDADVLLPWSMLFRTPVTPVVAGLSLDVAGGALAEPLAAVLFAHQSSPGVRPGLLRPPRSDGTRPPPRRFPPGRASGGSSRASFGHT